MKILFLTQYFPPEVGAPQNRLYDLAKQFIAAGEEVEILTAMPNYPHMKVHEGYRNKWYVVEEKEGIKIHRSWIYTSPSKGILRRLLNYFSFVYSSLVVGSFRTNKYDVILVESPPLFLGISGYLLAKLKGSKLLMNISDLWPESAEKLGIVKNKTALSLAGKLELFLYKKSWKISGQTQGIVGSIAERTGRSDVIWLPNGVDISIYKEDVVRGRWRADHEFAEDDFLCFYGGIIGHAQKLETILEVAEKMKSHQKIRFVFLGEGPEKDKLQQLAIKIRLENVHFLPAVRRDEMPQILKNVDLAIVPLQNIPLFEGAIPSKIFEAMAMKIPVVLGVNGEAKSLFVDQAKAALHADPENSAAYISAIQKIYNSPEFGRELGKNGYKCVQNSFTRTILAQHFLKALKG